MDRAAMMGPLDLTVVVLYFVGIIGFGAYAARHSRGVRDFFLGGQRFSWWFVAFSCVATVVGSYSFVKYSAAGFKYGLSSSQTYLNDWFWMPLWMFGWLPLVYYARITSVPEFFKRRFSGSVRTVAMLLLLVYLIGYLGINFLTMGRALEALVGWPLLFAAGLAALICGVYTSHGGQTAVIFTDLAQGVLLIVAGLGLFLAGLWAVGGPAAFWNLLTPLERQALPAFNHPPDFNFVGIFWQDGMAGGIAFYFMNQGILLRFLSARSVGHARRAAAVVILVLMPLAAVAVSGAGWIGRAMVGRGMLPADTPASAIFVDVAEKVLPAGFFGLVVAALIAALMSTADTLINAIATIAVVDFWRPIRSARHAMSERAELRAARIASIAATLIGFGLVPVFAGFGSIYKAHGAFTAAITPPLVVALILAFCWKRVSTTAVMLVMLGGTAVIALSFFVPQMIEPFAHGIDLAAGSKSYVYIRALFGLAVCTLLGIGGTLLWPNRKPVPDILTLGPVSRKRDSFKGAPAAEGVSGLSSRLLGFGVEDNTLGTPPDDRPLIGLSPVDARLLGAEAGDLLTLHEDHWFRGGYQALTGRAVIDRTREGAVSIPRSSLARLRITGERLFVVQRLM